MKIFNREIDELELLRLTVIILILSLMLYFTISTDTTLFYVLDYDINYIEPNIIEMGIFDFYKVIFIFGFVSCFMFWVFIDSFIIYTKKYAQKIFIKEY